MKSNKNMKALSFRRNIGTVFTNLQNLLEFFGMIKTARNGAENEGRQPKRDNLKKQNGFGH